MASIRRIGILTSGGDCAGLNPVIRAVVSETGKAPDPPQGPPPGGDEGAPARSGYQPIPVTIEK